MGDQFNSLETQFNKVTECTNSIGTFHLLFQRHLSHLLQWPGVQKRTSIFLLFTDIIAHIAWVRHGFLFNICIDVVVGECNIKKKKQTNQKTKPLERSYSHISYISVAGDRKQSLWWQVVTGATRKMKQGEGQPGMERERWGMGLLCFWQTPEGLLDRWWERRPRKVREHGMWIFGRGNSKCKGPGARWERVGCGGGGAQVTGVSWAVVRTLPQP